MAGSAVLLARERKMCAGSAQSVCVEDRPRHEDQHPITSCRSHKIYYARFETSVPTLAHRFLRCRGVGIGFDKTRIVQQQVECDLEQVYKRVFTPLFAGEVDLKCRSDVLCKV